MPQWENQALRPLGFYSMTMSSAGEIYIQSESNPQDAAWPWQRWDHKQLFGQN